MQADQNHQNQHHLHQLLKTFDPYHRHRDLFDRYNQREMPLDRYHLTMFHRQHQMLDTERTYLHNRDKVLRLRLDSLNGVVCCCRHAMNQMMNRPLHDRFAAVVAAAAAEVDVPWDHCSLKNFIIFYAVYFFFFH